MNELIVICPKCKNELHLTESLAAPLLAKLKNEYQQKLSQKDSEIEQRENEVSKKERKIDDNINEQVAKLLVEEKNRIINEESKRAKLLAREELDQKSREVSDLLEALKGKDKKLEEAHNQNAEFLKKQRVLEDERREMNLTVEKLVQSELLQAKKLNEENFSMQLREKDQLITSMNKTITELKQKSEQGSQQLQGEVQELELEAILRNNFPLDDIEPVPKGKFGGDVLQNVKNQANILCGTILWESKRTRNWSNDWLAKLRDDQRASKADIAILATQILPKEVDNFGMLGNIWVVHMRFAVPCVTMLRETLIRVNQERKTHEGRETKAEMVYRYLTSKDFRQRIEAIVEAFSVMQDDLNKERQVITRQWEKRQKQIEKVINTTSGIYGNLQGIAGKEFQEIESLELQAITGEELE